MPSAKELKLFVAKMFTFCQKAKKQCSSYPGKYYNQIWMHLFDHTYKNKLLKTLESTEKYKKKRVRAQLTITTQEQK